ncbi:MAG: hypothetical protein WDA06_01020 [Phenylobacterium sp.]
MGKNTVPVFLNREKFNVLKEVSYLEFRNILKMPEGRALYLRDRGKLLEVTEDNFSLRPGQHYFDVPDWIEGEALSLPPLLAEDLSSLKKDFSEERIKIRELSGNEWEILVYDFPTTPELQKIYGKGVLKFKVSKTYPQTPIKGLYFDSPKKMNFKKSCFSCKQWDPQRNGLFMYLCGVQKWMEAK